LPSVGSGSLLLR